MHFMVLSDIFNQAVLICSSATFMLYFLQNSVINIAGFPVDAAIAFLNVNFKELALNVAITHWSISCVMKSYWVIEMSLLHFHSWFSMTLLPWSIILDQ